MMPSLLLLKQKKKRLDHTNLECLEEAGCRCRLSVPRAHQGRPISPRYSSASALELRDLGPDHSIAEPSKLTQQGVAALTYPGRQPLNTPIKSRDVGLLSPIPSLFVPPSVLLLLLHHHQKCSPCSPSRTRLLLPEPPATHRSHGTKSARGSHASGVVPEGYCR